MNRTTGSILPIVIVAALSLFGCSDESAAPSDGPMIVASPDPGGEAQQPSSDPVPPTGAADPQDTGEPAMVGDEPSTTPTEVLEPEDAEVTMPTAANADWVSYSNGPQSWFANLGETTLGVDNVANLTMKWMINSEVTAPPAVVGDRLWVTTAEDGLIAFEAETGNVIWEDTSVSSFSGPAYDPTTETIYVNRWEGGVLHAFDANDGTLRWSSPISDQDAVRGWSSPVVAGNQLVVGIASSDRGQTFKGGLAVFDLAGEVRSLTYTHAQETAAGVAIWAGPSIDVDAQAAFAGSGNNYTLAGDHSDSLFGIDLGTGDMLWNNQLAEDDRWAYDCILCGPDHDFGTNPILIEYNGRRLLAAGQKSGSFWMLDRETGQVLWEKVVSSTSHPAYGGVLNNGAFDGSRILVAGNDGGSPGTLYALDPDPDGGGRVLWERPLGGLVLAPITTANGLAFVPVGSTMEVIATATGETLTVLQADAPVAGAAAISNGRVFFGSGLSYYDDGAEPGSFYAYGL